LTQNHDNILYFLKNFAIFHALLNNAYFIWQLCYRFHYQLLITVISYKDSDIYHVGQPKRLSNTLHLDPPFSIQSPFPVSRKSFCAQKLLRENLFILFKASQNQNWHEQWQRFLHAKTFAVQCSIFCLTFMSSEYISF